METKTCKTCNEEKSIKADFIWAHHESCRICVLRAAAKLNNPKGKFARMSLQQMGL